MSSGITKFITATAFTPDRLELTIGIEGGVNDFAITSIENSELTKQFHNIARII